MKPSLIPCSILGACLIASPLMGSAPLTPAEERALPDTRGAATPSEPVTLWVETAKLGGRRSLEPGTELRSEPNAASPVARVFAAGDGIALQRVEGTWAQVRLYPGQVQPAPSVATEAPLPPETPAASVVTVAPASAPDLLAPASAAPVAPPPAPVVAPAPAPSILPAPAAPPAPALVSSTSPGPVRFFAGTLVKTRGFLFTRPPAAYEIIDEAGYRIAFVDTSRILKMIEERKLLNRYVQISGTATAIRSGKDTLLVAESITLR